MHLLHLIATVSLFAYPSSAGPIAHFVAKAREFSSGTVSSSTPVGIPRNKPTVPPEVTYEQAAPGTTHGPEYWASWEAAHGFTRTTTWSHRTNTIRDVATDDGRESSPTTTSHPEEYYISRLVAAMTGAWKRDDLATADVPSATTTPSTPIFTETKPTLEPNSDAGNLADPSPGTQQPPTPSSSSDAGAAETAGPQTDMIPHSAQTSKFFPEIVLVTPGASTTETNTLPPDFTARSKSTNTTSPESVITAIDLAHETVITPIDPWWTTTSSTQPAPEPTPSNPSSAKRSEEGSNDEAGTTVVKVVVTHTAYYDPATATTAAPTTTSSSSNELPLWMMTLTDIGTWTMTAPF